MKVQLNSMNPLFTLLLTIIQIRRAIAHQRAVELAEIADREREAALNREADRAAQLREITRTREHAEKAYKESWAGSRAEAVDEALAWGKRVGVPVNVLQEMSEMRAQVEHLAGSPGMGNRAAELLRVPRAELDDRLDVLHSDLGTLIAAHEGVIPEDDDRVADIHERMVEQEQGATTLFDVAPPERQDKPAPTQFDPQNRDAFKDFQANRRLTFPDGHRVIVTEDWVQAVTGANVEPERDREAAPYPFYRCSRGDRTALIPDFWATAAKKERNEQHRRQCEWQDTDRAAPQHKQKQLQQQSQQGDGPSL